jgi:hypothetical protein
MVGCSGVAAQLATSRECLTTIELVSWLFGWLID